MTPSESVRQDQSAGPRTRDRETLPSAGSIQLSREHQALLWEAGCALDRLDGALAALPMTDTFREMQVRSEVASSCILDGERVSLADLLALQAELLPPEDRPAADLAMLAVRSAEEAIKGETGTAFDPDRLAGIVTAVYRAREHSEGDSAISGTHLLDAILASHGERSDLPEIVRVAITQARVELIGPFGRGNGLAGRFVAIVLLYRRCGTVLGHARFLHRQEQQYRQSLDSVVRSNSWDNWIAFYLRCVSESAADCVETISRLVAMREQHREGLAGGLGYAVSKGLVVLDRLFQQPLTTVADVQQTTGTSYVAANTLVRRLVDLGILEEVTGYRRNRVFRYGDYTGLFGVGSSVPVRKRAPSRAHAEPPPATAPAPRKPRPKRPAPISDHLL